MSDNKEKLVNLGLGDAILRLVRVQFQHHMNFGDTNAANKEETQMIVEALNQYELDLGFDCNMDGVPDTVGDLESLNSLNIFNVSAKTSCCRISFTGEKQEESKKKSTIRRKKTNSRRKK